VNRRQLAHWLTRVRPMELAELLKKLLRIGHDEFEVDGRTWYLDPASDFGSRLLAEQTYEGEVTEALLSLLGPGDVFLDIGANEGWYSVRAAERVGAAGKVIAIEPQARLWPVILRNFQLNRLHNYRLMPYAVGCSEGFIEISVYPSVNTGASSLVSQPRTRAMRRQKAGILPLSRIAQICGISGARLAKIDVEGFELEVLKSAGDLLGRIEHIYLELHPRQLEALGQSTEEVERLLETSGYRKRQMTGVELWTFQAAGASPGRAS
jgi:FkbM family methyltransferase